MLPPSIGDGLRANAQIAGRVSQLRQNLWCERLFLPDRKKALQSSMRVIGVGLHLVRKGGDEGRSIRLAGSLELRRGHTKLRSPEEANAFGTALPGRYTRPPRATSRRACAKQTGRLPGSAA